VRHPTPDPPAAQDVHGGLATTLWLPEREPAGGVVILHGAGSVKENHYDFARACRGAGLAAIVADLRGHGDSAGAMDGGALDDVALLAGVLREAVRPDLAIGLRGSSMGGWLALCGARQAGAAAVVAICPATSEGLLRGLRAGSFDFEADGPALELLLGSHDPAPAAAALDGVPILLLHAEGDERVPVEHSRRIHAAAPWSRLVTVPGGHHRSIQHDPELQGESLRFLARALRDERRR
jgi:pimeloyl-ACP methyl ester carboxylesterase